MGFENEFKGGNLTSFKKDGLSQQERNTDRDNNLTLEERERRLRMGAKEVVAGERYAPIIRELLKQYGSAELITDEVCEAFAEKHPEFPFEPMMVRMIAEEMEAQDRKQH
jgi:hypothetical protein